ncbi:MAG: MACPF domain-containing protein [Treponema sp.]|nr:MACPF domain-containing protein [Treponema sp.]
MKSIVNNYGIIVLAVIVFLIGGIFSSCDIVDDIFNNEDENNIEAVETYEGFIGFGYHVINSPFFQSESVRFPVLDTNRMAEDGLIFVDNQRQRTTETIFIVGETLSAFMNNFSMNAGFQARALFGASLQANFGLTTSSEVEETKSFAQSSTVLVRRRDFVGPYNLSDLRNKYLLEGFRDNWLMNNSICPEELMEIFGTHIMLQVFLGGRLDMSYTIDNSSRESSTRIQAGLRARFGVVSGNVNVDHEAANFFQQSQTNEVIRSFGGRVDVDMTTFENARRYYTQWSASIEETDNLTLIRTGRIGNRMEMLPIWELIDPAWPGGRERRNAIEEEFDRQLIELGANIDIMQRRGFIENIFTATGNMEDVVAYLRSIAAPRNINVILDPIFGSVFIGYTTTSDPSEAITNILIRREGRFFLPRADDIIINVNEIQYNLHLRQMMNITHMGSGSTLLYYTRDPKAGAPLQALALEVHGEFTNSTSQINGASLSSRWSRVNLITTPESNLGFNFGESSNRRFLWVQR